MEASRLALRLPLLQGGWCLSSWPSPQPPQPPPAPNVSFCIGAVLDSMHRAYVWCMVGEAAWEWDTCDNCLYWTQPCRCLLDQRERGWGKGPDVRSFRVDDGSTWPTGWLPTTFDPCTGIGNQTLAVYRKPPRRGRIHIICTCPTPQ